MRLGSPLKSGKLSAIPYRVARDSFVISNGSETSCPANVGFTDSAVAFKPPRFKSVCGIEIRNTLVRANISR